jgi:peptidoglycan-associated lipoprotein
MRVPHATLTPLALALAGAITWTGCATKGYVRKQVGDLRTEVTGADTSLRTDVDQARTAADQAMDAANRASGAADAVRGLALGDADYREAGRYRVYFDFNSDQLSDESRATLDRVADDLAKNPQYYVGLYGFTDERGPDAYNLTLGMRRATAVQRYLLGRNTAEFVRYQVASFGETAPDTEKGGLGEGKQQRQVLILLAERVARSGELQHLSQEE